MGISNLTVTIIANRENDVRTDVGGPNKDGKFVPWVVLHKPDGGGYDHELVSGPLMDTWEQALESAQNIIDTIRTKVSSKDVENKITELLSTLN